MFVTNPCGLCPRECGANRNHRKGFCGGGTMPKVARAALHFWEEPCISGTQGSGTVFFSGCSLQCAYCQNFKISSQGFGREISTERLAAIFLELQDQGAHNINLVTATPHLIWVVEALDRVKAELSIPVVYNSSGYEKVEIIKALKDYVDIWLPDFKYFGNESARRYSNVPDYFEVASAAIGQMDAQTGAPVFDAQGIMRKGVIIRHMLLPGGRKDSLAILRWISNNLPIKQYWLSLMSQYTPAFRSKDYREINRRVTSFEYDSVVKEALLLGLTNTYVQERSSAREEYTPPFDLKGV